MATPEVLMQSIREGLGAIQFSELDEDDRKILTTIDTEIWDLVDAVTEKKEEG